MVRNHNLNAFTVERKRERQRGRENMKESMFFVINFMVMKENIN